MLLGIDLGTSSLKAMLFDPVGGTYAASADAGRAAEAVLRDSDVFEPVPAWADALEDRYAQYAQLYPALRPLFARGASEL